MIFFFQGNFDDNTTVAIQSVTAVPVEEWSLDFIRPKPVCVKKDGQCVPSMYPNAPDYKKVIFFFFFGFWFLK